MLYNFERGLSLTEFSSKLPALLDNIKNAPKEKHYVYSNFHEARGSGQGILEIARQLEANGYKKLTVKDAKEWVAKGQLPPKGNRYVLALQKDLGEEGTTSAGDNLASLLQIYNSPENKNGDIVHVFLATQGFNEGIDLKAVRNIHIFEPLVTVASDLQTIGRARRFCSHKDLDREKGEWTVQVHRYVSDFPVGFSTNNTDKIEKDMEETQKILEYNTEKYEKMKKMKPEQIEKEFGYAAHKTVVKNLIDEKTKEMKNLKKDLQNAKKNNLKDIKMIDDYIRANALEKMKELFILHQLLKETAVDCQILEAFHNASGAQKIKCSSPFKA